VLPVNEGAIRSTTADLLVWELGHPEYIHAQAIHLVRELFDAGAALLDVIAEEQRTFGDRTPPSLREGRGALLTFLETVASYLNPFGEVMSHVGRAA
jgi:hypothetical protein